jgi:hypothetical protein
VQTTRSDLLALSGAELDARFAAATAGPIPDGTGRGVALAWTGTWAARPFAAWAATGWRGKSFDAAAGRLQNRLTPFGLLGITAEVWQEASWTDGEPCIVLDYARTSRLARRIRDEIRMLEPGRYLGVVFLGRRKLPVHFALTFDQ